MTNAKKRAPKPEWKKRGYKKKQQDAILGRAAAQAARASVPNKPWAYMLPRNRKTLYISNVDAWNADGLPRRPRNLVFTPNFPITE